MKNKEILMRLETDAYNDIELVDSIHALNETKAKYLGKKSGLQEVMASMKDLSIDEKKELGQLTNKFRVNIEAKLDERKNYLENKEVEKRLEQEKIDITLPGKKIKIGKMHPLSKMVEEIEDIFLGMGYTIEEGPEVEEDLFNFEMLNLPVGHPAREMQDSFYINDTILLRTHTSPVQAHALLKASGTPIKIICPGKVYRRDNDDATHSHQFMQCEGLVVGENVTMADLKGTLQTLAQHLFGNELDVRFRPSFFPFTEPSVEVDVECFKCKGKGCSLCKNTGFIEVLGAGMVHPNVLKMAGYDTTKFQGFAFGVGIERVTMLRHGIDDIRHFYINDSRFLKQF